jgi:hypothetical protein
MNYISRSHKRISEREYEDAILTYPQDYFGPNYRDLLNFWVYYETLSDYQLGEVWEKIWAMDADTWRQARAHLRKLSDQSDWLKVSRDIMSAVEMEICFAHIILEQGESLVFLPIYLDTYESVTPT